jgi:DNA-binding beta-propeller fold protein YncE
MRHLSRLVLAAAFAAPAFAAPPAYRPVASIPLGAPDRWDYVVSDPASGRIYLAHGDRLAVIDGRSATLIGNVEGINGGAHGTAISAKTGLGFTDDGRNGQAIAFDLTSLKPVKAIPADQDADAVAADPLTGHIFVIEGDPGAITVIDPKAQAVVATIKAGEKMEYATAGEPGILYVAGEEKSDLLKVDARANKVAAHWPTPDCASPHGLAFDGADKRLFMGCVNGKLMVVDAVSGHVVTELAIGRGSDAIAWDPKRRRLFSSNGADGTVSVYQQLSADRYQPLEPLQTAVSGRTMAVDPQSGRLFIAAAETQPNPAGGRPKVVPGTLKLLVFEPTS